MKAKAGVIERRKSALKRLISQLDLGFKPAKNSEGKRIVGLSTPLNDFDIKRIKKEIEILEGRLKGL